MPDISEMYFSRAARYHELDGQIVTIAPNSPRVITMDPWPQLVFEMADGEHTVKELERHLSAQYDDGPPKDLIEQVHAIVRDLEQQGLVRLHPQPSVLPPELANPIQPEDSDT